MQTGSLQSAILISIENSFAVDFYSSFPFRKWLQVISRIPACDEFKNFASWFWSLECGVKKEVGVL